MSALPKEFADLEPFAAEWALATEKERYFKLANTSLDSLRRFYEAMLPRAEAATAFLSALPQDRMPEEARRLYDLLLTFVETAYPIELKWKSTTVEFTVEADRLKFHGPSAARYG